LEEDCCVLLRQWGWFLSLFIRELMDMQGEVVFNISCNTT
jgi:hypothetical protein